MRIGLIFNPSASGDKARDLKSQLDELAGECDLLPTEGPGHAEDLAEQAVTEGCELLVAAGGDGTVQEVSNGLVRHPGGLARVALGILPLGTVNVMARVLGIPLDFEAAWRVIQRGHTRRIDLPWMELQINGETRRRCFPALGGAGLDARACELVGWEMKKRSGQLAYIIAGFQAVSETMPTFRVVADGQVIESAEIIMLGNGKMYGGPFDVFPNARLDDGKVDALVAETVSGWRAPEYAHGILTGTLPSLDGVHYLQAETIELKPLSDERVVVQLDGDAWGQLPAEISVEPLALRMVVPQPEN
jgi:YegS/Rv2252/BmrU family lipid kinase